MKSQLFSSWPSSPAGRPARTQQARPSLEVLEGRAVPTVLIQPHWSGTKETTDSDHRYTLQSDQVVLIYAGGYWNSTQGKKDQQTLTTSIKTLLASSYLSGLVQYGSDGKASYYTSAKDSQGLALDDPKNGAEPTGDDLLAYVQAEIAAHSTLKPTASSNPKVKLLYFVLNDPGHSGPGSGIWGLNWTDGSLHAAYVGTRFFSSGALNLDGFTQTFSHELVEATASAVKVSDPHGYNAGSQVADNEPEKGKFYTGRVNGVKVQAYWSTKDKGWIIPDGHTPLDRLTPIFSNGAFNGSYRPTPGTGKLVLGRNADYVLTSAGSLWRHTGSNSSSGWTELTAYDVTSFNLGVDEGGKDAVFAVFKGGALWEYTGSQRSVGAGPTWTKLSSSGATGVRGSLLVADRCFASFGGDLWEHHGISSQSGWIKLLDKTANVTAFSAGKGSDGSAAVFAKVNGKLWEHSGSDPQSGWAQLSTSDVSSIMGSQVQADTVFATFGSTLWEHNGTDGNTGWVRLLNNSNLKSYTSGLASNGTAAVFALIGDALWEHTGTDPNTGWVKLQSSGVTGLSGGSQVQANTVFVTEGSTLYKHMGQDSTSGWTAIL